MSAHVSGYLRVLLPELPELPSRARHLAETLGHFANRDGLAWCSVPTLAARMGVTPATVRRARAACTDAGIFTVDLSAGGHPEATNVYRFPVVAAIHTPRADARGSDPVPRALTRVTPRADARDPARWRAPKIHEGDHEAPAAHGDDTTPAWWRERFGYLVGEVGA